MSWPNIRYIDHGISAAVLPRPAALSNLTDHVFFMVEWPGSTRVWRGSTSAPLRRVKRQEPEMASPLLLVSRRQHQVPLFSGID